MRNERSIGRWRLDTESCWHWPRLSRSRWSPRAEPAGTWVRPARPPRRRPARAGGFPRPPRGSGSRCPRPADTVSPPCLRAAVRWSLSETGSTLLSPLLRAWAAAYHRQYPQLIIRTAGTGSGKGIAAASAGTADIGASDAYLSSGDLVKNPSLLNIPLAIAAQQVDYNVPSLGANVHINLSGLVLAQMYEGQITTWDSPAIRALNPGVSL